jgi:hypothetical protein
MVKWATIPGIVIYILIIPTIIGYKIYKGKEMIGTYENFHAKTKA